MKYITYIFTFVAVAAVSLTAVPVQAQSLTDFDWHGDRNPTLEKKNMAPGDTAEHAIGVSSEATDPLDVYINLDRASGFDDDFAEQLKFYVIDRSSGKYLVGGSGDRMNLKEAVEDGDIFIERLDAGDDNTYVVKVRFDKEAGNEYQDRSTKFDITMEISGELTEGGDVQDAPYRPGQLAGGNEAPEGEVLGIEDVRDEGAGETGDNENIDTGVVLGAEDMQCRDQWSWWVWAILAVIFGGLFNFARVTRTPRWRHVFRIVSVLGALGIWYFYDNCHSYWWFLVAAAMIAAVSIFLRGQYAETDEE
jgi:hypothetical protein